MAIYFDETAIWEWWLDGEKLNTPCGEFLAANDVKDNTELALL